MCADCVVQRRLIHAGGTADGESEEKCRQSREPAGGLTRGFPPGPKGNIPTGAQMSLRGKRCLPPWPCSVLRVSKNMATAGI